MLVAILKDDHMTKEELIIEIQTTFKDIKLDDGVGIWEGQGLDEYADEKTILELRKKDERDNWDCIPYKDLDYCYSSLSFFDAKGMRFCLPKLLMFDLLNDIISKEQNISSPDLLFTLGYNLNEEFQKSRFSLFDKAQIETIIHYLEYKSEDFILTNKEYTTDYEYVELSRTLTEWRQKLN